MISIALIAVLSGQVSARNEQDGTFVVEPCELQIAPFYSSDVKSALPGPVSILVFEDGREISSTLLRYSEQYALKHLDPTSGMLYDSSGALNVRDTAISALLWAELGRMELAKQALSAVLSTQFLDPSDRTLYGNFPVHPGETPTDSNWSAFIGSYLLVFWDRYRHELSPYLSAQVLRGIRASAMHRTCVRYELHSGTNIKILSSFVLIRAGEVLNDKDLLEAGKILWGNFVSFTLSNGIAEYNSPNYLKVDLYGLGFMVDYIHDQEVVSQARQIRELFWWSITQHYHSPTFQLAGPFSRTYTDRMLYQLTGIQSFLYEESSGRIPLPDYPGRENDDQTLHAFFPALVRRSWPEEWIELALAPSQGEREFRERTRLVTADGVFQQITTFFTDRLAVGSVNTERLSSSQRRSFVAHAVDAQAQGVGVFRLFSITPGAWIKSVQKEGSILAVVQFYDYEENSTLEYHLQWYGTATDVPRYSGTLSPSYGDLLSVNWMGVPVFMRIGPLQTFDSIQSIMQIGIEPASSLLSFSWKGELLESPEETVASNETDVIMVPLAFFFDTSDQHGYMSLAPITVSADNSDGIYRFSWNSPCGLLELETSANDPWFVRELITGVPTQPFPLAPMR